MSERDPDDGTNAIIYVVVGIVVCTIGYVILFAIYFF